MITKDGFVIITKDDVLAIGFCFSKSSLLEAQTEIGVWVKARMNEALPYKAKDPTALAVGSSRR